jgi:hypothetical protein
MLTADEKELTAFLRDEFRDVPKEKMIIKLRGLEAVRFKLWSPWKPDFDWFEALLVKYPSCWIKNEWIVEDGEAGTWIGTARNGQKMIRQLMWDDMSIEESAYRFRNVKVGSQMRLDD